MLKADLALFIALASEDEGVRVAAVDALAALPRRHSPNGARFPALSAKRLVRPTMMRRGTA